MRLSSLSSVSILGWKRDAAHLVRFRVELEQCVVVKNPGPWVFAIRQLKLNVQFLLTSS
jgi:hypothetical protein